MAEDKPPVRRINVAVTPQTVAALQLVVETEGVTLTEAVRRLVGYGEHVYRTVRVEGGEVLTRKDGDLREVVIL